MVFDSQQLRGRVGASMAGDNSGAVFHTIPIVYRVRRRRRCRRCSPRHRIRLCPSTISFGPRLAKCRPPTESPLVSPISHITLPYPTNGASDVHYSPRPVHHCRQASLASPRNARTPSCPLSVRPSVSNAVSPTDIIGSPDGSRPVVNKSGPLSSHGRSPVRRLDTQRPAHRPIINGPIIYCRADLTRRRSVVNAITITITRHCSPAPTRPDLLSTQ